MVSKKLLSAAIAAAFISVPAFAQINLDADTGAVKFAKEAVVDANEDAGMLTVAAAGGNLDVTAEIGSGVSAANQIYVRFDLTNGAFVNAVSAGDLTVTGPVNAPSVQVQSGGAAGQSYVIFQITADADPVAGPIDQDDVLALAIADLEISTSAGVSAKYAAYDTPASAVNQVAANQLATSTYANAITVVNALSSVFTAGTTATAEVAEDFTEFLAASLSETLGSVEFVVDTTVLLPDSSTITALTDVVDSASDLVVAGDLSFGDFELDGCAIDSDTGSLEDGGDCVVTDFSINTAYDFSVTVDGSTTIIPGEYTASVDYVKLATGLFNPVDGSGVVGNIARNGTSVKVPFVNINPAFNQKIIIINRGTNAVPLTISDLIADVQTTGFALTTTGASTISLPAGKQTVLSSVDLFQVDPASVSKKGAATLNIAAPMGKIDVLFQTTNADGAQNTIILQTDGKKFGGN
ncbi:hypothetical protein [Cellvibrio fibrivorans]|uniref:Uncharacterized protein n=1 Tax=Cellvibrio fibrivorans TaxID=126350 RepID=A0ABU1UU36_9GAMM|nr:hypothetical protein [Cellvibrio fibrivorans]MDR7088699.1 hypothetical protein [Cellvibrio fibrivorans]